MQSQRAYRFSRTQRLSGRRAFSAVFDARTRESRGPLTVFALPNTLGRSRLGFSVSRKVGIAVRRNRIKRLLREAHRLMQHELPGGYDLVVVVRPHEPLALAEYQKLLSALSVRLDEKWQTRRQAERPGSDRRDGRVAQPKDPTPPR